MVATPDVIALFDIDGTLTKPRNEATPDMYEFLKELRTKVTIGIVGGSDHVKQQEQLSSNVVNMFDYVFAENGLVAFKGGNHLAIKSLKDEYTEDQLKEFINFVLHYIADLDIPVKRGTFVEFRSGLINISPVGRNCSQSERDDFERYDKIHHVREKLVAILKEKFAHMNFKYSIGGQISFDVFPIGWDKTYCLRFLDSFKVVHFFGDKTSEGGNDYEIYASERTIGHTVKGPEDTVAICKEIFFK